MKAIPGSSARAAALSVALLVALGAPARAAEPLFRIEDPHGDDSGAGGLMYPARPDLKQGDLDLVAFSARLDERDEGTWFTVEFAHPVRDPGGDVTALSQTPIASLARLGFHTFNVDVYIDTDRVAGSGSVDTVPGRGLSIDRATAWEKAVILTPRPDVARLMLKQELGAERESEFRARVGRVLTPDLRKIEAQADLDVDARYYFPRRVRVSGRQVSFFVPTSFLGAPASRHWAYAVIVTGADIEEYGRAGQLSPRRPTMFVMPTARGISFDAFGIRGDGDAATPPVVDILAPEPGAQARILNDFDAVAGRLAAVPGVAPDGSVSLTPAGTAATAEVAREIETVRRGAPPAAAPAAAAPAGGGASRPAAPAGAVAEQPGQPRSIAERLRALNQLLQQGLITQAEHAELRRKILAEL